MIASEPETGGITGGSKKMVLVPPEDVGATFLEGLLSLSSCSAATNPEKEEGLGCNAALGAAPECGEN